MKRRLEAEGERGVVVEAEWGEWGWRRGGSEGEFMRLKET